MNPKTWKEYLAAMDHSKGTSNAMIQAAMKKEIGALKRALREERQRVLRSREAAKTWRAAATRYQKLAAERRP